MGTSQVKKLQLVIGLSLIAFAALGFSLIKRGAVEFGILRPTLFANGPQKKEVRSVGEFLRVDAGAIYDVDISFGDKPSVTIDAPQSLIHHLTSTIEGETLVLGCDSNISIDGESRVRAHIVTRHLNGASISGAGQMVIRGKVTTNEFDAYASGAAKLTMTGAVNTMTIEASGSAKTKFDGLKAQDLRVQASGAAECVINGSVNSSKIEASGASNVFGRLTSDRAEVQASGASHITMAVKSSISGEASGASSITYSGHPTVANVETSGVSSVNRD